MDEKSSLNIRTSEEKSFLEKLLWSKFKDWNADELCLLDAYLTRINPQNPEGGKVRFTLKEYANLLGVSDLCYEQIESCTRKFLGNVVTINYEEKFETIIPLIAETRNNCVFVLKSYSINLCLTD